MSAQPATRVLSSSQLQTLADHGEERTAQAGETLYDIGDRTYPFIAIIEGEAAILDTAGEEIVRHGPSGFLGEINLLSGQTVFLRAVATKPMRYLAVDRERLKKLLYEDGSLSDLLLNAFVERRELLQQRHGIGPQIIGSTARAAPQARKFGARIASPYRAVALESGSDRHLVKLDDDRNVAARAVLLSTGAEYRRLPVEGLGDYEGWSVFYAAGPEDEQLCAAQRVGVVGGGNSAGQAAVALSRGGALVTLLHRRADLGETMSQYLIGELEEHGVAVRARSEGAELHGSGGARGSVTLT